MKNFKNILFYTILLSLFTLLISACDTPPKQKIKQNKNVVTKKIVNQDQNNIKITTPQKENQNDVEPSVVEGKKPEAKMPPVAQTPQPETAKEPPVAQTPQPEAAKEPPVAQTPQPEAEVPAVNAKKEELQGKNNLKKTMEEDKSEKQFYVSEGKIDPFLSPIAKQNAAEKKKISNRKLTPLEKLDLSQVKLVAIINMKSGKKNVAMVQESNGKGYMVKVGTFIGTNKGRIIEIKNDEIIIKENIKNFKGVYEDRLKQMKLQKKDNG